MSGSVKKTPVMKDGTGTKTLQWSKRCANKKVRRTKAIASGKAYRKVYDPWIIHDRIYRVTLGQYKYKNLEFLNYHLLKQGSLEELPEWIIREQEDKHFINWKKKYYWK